MPVLDDIYAITELLTINYLFYLFETNCRGYQEMAIAIIDMHDDC